MFFEWNTPVGYLLGAQTDFVLAWQLQFQRAIFDEYGFANFVTGTVMLVAIVSCMTTLSE